MTERPIGQFGRGKDLIMMQTLAFGMPGLTEWIIIGALGLLFFGKRLPEVGRSLGKGIVEFKRGLKGIEDDVEQASSGPAPRQFKYDPETGKPLESKSNG